MRAAWVALLVGVAGAGCGGGGSGGDYLDEGFVGDGGAWPAGWQALGGVSSATVVAGRGRLVPAVSGYSLARMGHPLDGAGDVEATFQVTMDDVVHQGVGLYVRQNGGYLQQSAMHGGGYAVFVDGFRGPQLELWRERDGVEEMIGLPAAAAIADHASYKVRFRCVQDGGATSLDAKIWGANEAEPDGWMVSANDGTDGLQRVAGGVAIDAWNTATSGADPAPQPIFVDNVELFPP